MEMKLHKKNRTKWETYGDNSNAKKVLWNWGWSELGAFFVSILKYKCSHAVIMNTDNASHEKR